MEMADTKPNPNPSSSSAAVIQAVRQYRGEADKARRSRLVQNRANMQAYMGQQDFSGKQKGQSREFIPKTSTSVEQFAAFVKRALTQVGNDWYQTQLGKDSKSPLTEEQLRALLNCYLDNLPVGMKTTSFAVTLSDAVKVGLLEALIILKVHGRTFQDRVFAVEPGAPIFDQSGRASMTEPKLKQVPFERWKLQIDVVRPEDYFPDPTGRNLYEIHRVERDLHEVIDAAKAGIYDVSVVQQIHESYERAAEERRRADLRGQDESTSPDFRKKIVIDEFWGSILTPDGRVAERNVLTAVANDRYLIRPPEPNPYWHQESPFVAAPLLRVPFSVWHKAIYDSASPLNIALNEIFNLMLDGGIASVWGIKELNLDKLDDPRQVSGGIPQGETLLVRGTSAADPALHIHNSGQVPRDAMAMFGALEKEFNQATFTNELKLGTLPGKQVLATEVMEASQSQAVTVDSMASDIENELIESVLRKSFLTILQNADDLDSEEVVAAIGQRAALMLSRMSPAERYAALARRAQFKVNGLSATLARVRDFQKTMALIQAVGANPMLLRAFMVRFSADKTLTTIMKQLNIDPETIEKSPEELANLGNEMQDVMMLGNAMGGKGKGGSENGGGAEGAAQGTGNPGMPAEIAQQTNPMTSMV
jgi:hypothetical protein